jgi:hypothetical protein
MRISLTLLPQIPYQMTPDGQSCTTKMSQLRHRAMSVPAPGVLRGETDHRSPPIVHSDARLQHEHHQKRTATADNALKCSEQRAIDVDERSHQPIYYAAQRFFTRQKLATIIELHTSVTSRSNGVKRYCRRQNTCTGASTKYMVERQSRTELDEQYGMDGLCDVRQWVHAQRYRTHRSKSAYF